MVNIITKILFSFILLLQLCLGNIAFADENNKFAWTLQLEGDVIYPPFIGPDKTLYAVSNKADQSTLYSIEPTNSQIKWKYQFKDISYTKRDSVPTIGPDGTIYIIASNQQLYAIQNNGQLKWTFTCPPGKQCDKHLLRGGKSPTIAPDNSVSLIYQGDTAPLHDEIVNLNPDGSVKWIFNPNNNSSDLSYYTSEISTGKDGTVYVPIVDRGLVAINPDGSIKWEYDLTKDFYSPSNSPIIANDGTIYFTDLRGILHAINPDGTMKWIYRASENYTYFEVPPVLGSDGTIYLTTSHNTQGIKDAEFYQKLIAINPNGNVLWSHQFFVINPIVFDNDKIVVSGKDQNNQFGLFYFSPQGKLLWTHYFKDGSYKNFYPAIIPGESIYVSYKVDNNHTNITAIDRSSGGEIWAANYEGLVDKSPVASSDDAYLYFGASNGLLRALGLNQLTGFNLIDSQGDKPIESPWGIHVLINGKEQDFDAHVQIEEGRTLVPLRGIFEALGAEVQWDQDTQTITAKKQDTTISLQIYSRWAKKNNDLVELDIPPKITDGRTMVPARFVSEALGAKVYWDAEKNSVVINY